jgi:hypothetical protein
MIVKLYRKYIPEKINNKIYPLIDFIRTLRNPVWYYKNYEIRRKIRVLLPLFQDKSGMEIGGGTPLFSDNWNNIYIIGRK